MNELDLLIPLLANAPARVVVFDPTQRCVYANDAARRWHGGPDTVLLGRSVGQWRAEHGLGWPADAIDRVLAGETVEVEGWTDHPRHGRCFTQERITPWARPDGTAALAVGWGHDLTEARRREERLTARVAELQRVEQLKVAIVDNTFNAIITTDVDGRVVEFNPAAEAMFRVSRTQALGRPIAELIIPPRHHAAHHAGMARLARGGAPRVMGKRLQMHAIRTDGEEFPIEMVLFRTDAGGQTYYTASIADVSERERAAQVIEQQRDQLRQSEKLTAMGSLLAGVAHELNNPLAIVMGRASLLEEKTAGMALQTDAQRIREAAERCGRIVRTFLNMARQRPAERGAVRLNDLVRGAADLLQYSLRSSGVLLTLHLAEGLPELTADADRLGQLLLNLMVNAEQALVTRPEPRELRIGTGVETLGAQTSVWLRVADNGPGVPAEVRERIFDPYFTTKDESAGTGLGLAVARSVAREHGGELMLETGEPGASFLLRLPVQSALAGSPAEAPADEPAAPATQRVLVVDDEAEIADLMRAMIESAGYEVATAESGGVALELLAEARFDAIVSDLRMPDMDGAALWREVRARHPAMSRRMLFVTGDTLSPGARRFLNDAGCASLDKPFAKADLLAHVAALLREGTGGNG